MTDEERKIFTEYGVSEDEEYEIRFDGTPTPMMKEICKFIHMDDTGEEWCKEIAELNGKKYKVWFLSVGNGIPFVTIRECSYIIPIDCLAVYHMDFEPEEVSFF